MTATVPFEVWTADRNGAHRKSTWVAEAPARAAMRECRGVVVHGGAVVAQHPAVTPAHRTAIQRALAQMGDGPPVAPDAPTPRPLPPQETPMARRDDDEIEETDEDDDQEEPEADADDDPTPPPLTAPTTAPATCDHPDGCARPAISRTGRRFKSKPGQDGWCSLHREALRTTKGDPARARLAFVRLARGSAPAAPTPPKRWPAAEAPATPTPRPVVATPTRAPVAMADTATTALRALAGYLHPDVGAYLVALLDRDARLAAVYRGAP